MTWSAASPRRSMPEAPIGFVQSTPPDGFTGRWAPNFCSPRSTILQPWPTSQKPRFSSHIGSNHANGTYISTVWMSFHGFRIPARS